jgi:hypothetical protein
MLILQESICVVQVEGIEFKSDEENANHFPENKTIYILYNHLACQSAASH